MNHKYKQFVISFVAFALLLMQFGAIVHATDHPSHHEDALCVVFQAAEQHKHVLHDASVALFDNLTYSDAVGEITASFFSIFSPAYLSRGPPVITV